MLPLCARSPVCVRRAPALSGSLHTVIWPLSMKQSTIGNFFGKPAVAQSGAKPLAPSNAARQVTVQAKEVKTPEKKRIRDEQVRLPRFKVTIDCLQAPLSLPAANKLLHWQALELFGHTQCDAVAS